MQTVLISAVAVQMLPRTNASFVAEIAMMWRRLAIIVCAGLSCGLAAAAPADAPAPGAATAPMASPVPLPKPRPPAQPKPAWTPRADWSEPHSFREAVGPDFNSADVTSEPSACRLRLEKFAVVEAMPRLIGPGACGGSDIVRLDAVKLAGGKAVEIKPAPYLRCPMAEQLALFARDDVAPRVAAIGAALASIETYDDFDCRGRNRKSSGKISEHGKANAVDLRGVTFADGRFAALTDVKVDKGLRNDLRQSACRRFTTVLGPGSDGYHEEHIHLDLIQRRNDYRICQWDVREPPPLPPKPPESKSPEVKPADAKSADAKPADIKPADTKPDAAAPAPVTKPASTPAKVAEPAIPATADSPRFAEGAVPLPRPRPKAAEKPHHPRKRRSGFHFPFSIFR